MVVVVVGGGGGRIVKGADVSMVPEQGTPLVLVYDNWWLLEMLWGWAPHGLHGMSWQWLPTLRLYQQVSSTKD